MDLTKEVIDKILSLGVPNVIEHDGRKYSDRALSAIKPPQPDALAFFTLDGLVDFAQQVVITDRGFLLHVESPNLVKLYGALESQWKVRPCYAAAKNVELDFAFGRYYPVEDFIIKLLTQFDNAGQRAELLALVGNVREEKVRQTTDDGVTQAIQTRQGARFEEKVIPQTPQLAPFRIFREISAPLSPFVLRGKDGPQFALFDAGGESWKLEAVNLVVEYLREKLPEATVIG